MSRVLTSAEADVVQAVEERKPVWLECIILRLRIVIAELLVEGIHGLSGSEGLVVETIVEGGEGNEGASQSQPCVEIPCLGDGSHVRSKKNQ